MKSDHDCHRQRFEEEEQGRLAANATLSTDKRGSNRAWPQDDDSLRMQFHRDYTRIIHCRAFRRLRHKTQVFISPKNDHLCTRMEHSLHVASVATTIARALRLNEDLVRAIAVGHDLGHAPFGHKGERSLKTIAKAHGLTFSHELHSLRIVDYLESPYADHHGLNLTFAVRDGIACHYGEGFEPMLAPDRDKPVDALASMTRGKALPATLEGCVVRWADKVAYLGRDLEDAVALKIVERSQLPAVVQEVLGTTNREIIAKLVTELASNESGDDCISVGPEVCEALNAFYAFSMDEIYTTDVATKHYPQIDRAVKFLFDFLYGELKKAGDDISALKTRQEHCLNTFADFLEEDVRDWEKQPKAQLVLDFIAGMTDSYFVQAFTELFLPQSTV